MPSASRWFVLVSFVGLTSIALAACGPAAPAPRPGAPASDACVAIAERARRELLATVDPLRACTQDADCAAVSLSTSCFDSCAGSVNARSESALRAAVAKVDASMCAAFHERGCILVPQPCPPPPAPRCSEGRCTN